jgi:hypothetical protein
MAGRPFRRVAHFCRTFRQHVAQNPKISTSKVIVISLLLFPIVVLPYVIVAYFSNLLWHIVDAISALSKFDFRLLIWLAMMVTLLLYLLKLKQRSMYGIVEIVIAQFTIATGIIRLGGLGNTENSIVALLQMFTGMYLTIRGLDNTGEGLEGQAKEIWSDYFGPKMLPLRVTEFILYSCTAYIAFAPGYVSYLALPYMVLVMTANGLVLASLRASDGLTGGIPDPPAGQRDKGGASS